MREMLRLQGFPDSYQIVCNYSQTRKQAGNSLPVPVAKAILKNLFIAQGWHNGYVEYAFNNLQYQMVDGQMRIFEKVEKYGRRTKIKNSREIQAAVSTK
jgi:DNA (cytosine-5)-methyltransferase 1